MGLVILALLIVLLAGAVGYMYTSQASKSTVAEKKITDLESQFKQLNETNNAAKNNNLDKVEKDKFQSVFLTGGQVYFGKITNITDTQVTLENIYYLRDNSGSDQSLVKLGSELHGPEDKMFIERKNVQFWENLKPDSQVAKAIADYEKANPR